MLPGRTAATRINIGLAEPIAREGKERPRRVSRAWHRERPAHKNGMESTGSEQEAGGPHRQRRADRDGEIIIHPQSEKLGEGSGARADQE